MTYPNERRGRIYIEQTDRLGHFHQTDYVTFDVSFWQYIMPRGALTVIEGMHNDKETEEIMRTEDNRRESSSTCANCPRYLVFTCRAEDLLRLARTIIETYEKPAERKT